MRLTATFVLLLGILACTATAQTAVSTEQPTTARIEGKAINAVDNTPLRNVEITLMGNNLEGMLRAAKSDAEGRFSFSAIPPGTYLVSISRAGFVTRKSSRVLLTNGSMITLAEGDKIVDVTVPLWPAAVIRGKVLDATGEPVANARVSAFRTGQGKRAARRDSSHAATTDDNGDFRLFGLPPGKYIVMATAMGEGMEPAVADSDQGKESRSVATYYPSTANSHEATPIVLRSSDEFPLNILLTTAKTVHVRGRVSGKPAAMTFVILMAVEEFFFGGRAQVKDGKFDIGGVTPGRYMLQAISMNEGEIEPRMTRQMIEVGPAGAEDVFVLLGGRGKVSGSVSVEGGKLDLKKIRLMLLPAETSEFSSGFAISGNDRDGGRVSDDGVVQFKSVDAGRYRLMVVGNSAGIEDWYTKSVRIGTQDVTYSPFDVAADANVGFQMILSADGGTIEGVAVDDKEKPWGNVTVLSVPEAKRRQDEQSYGHASADQHGRFKIRGLAPGEYTVFALEDRDSISEFHDAEILRSMESSGVKVKVEGRDHKSVQPTVIPISDEAQQPPASSGDVPAVIRQ